MFDISVRLKPLSESFHGDDSAGQTSKSFNQNKKKTKRSKSTACLEIKNFHKRKKSLKNERTAFEVQGNKLSVKTDKNFFEYSFNKVFTPASSNFEVYENLVKKDLKKVLDGKWLTFMTYGTSGSGKTFTIFGDSFGSQSGIVYYACKRLFKIFKEKDITYEMTCCLLEIYNEQVTNLLPNNKNKVEVLENEDKNMVLQHAEKVKVKSAKELINLVNNGAKSRHIAENFSNKRSSRSHMIVLLELSFLYKGKVLNPKIAFLDLAGSERVMLDKKDLLLEGANINKSLLALTNCISILSDKKKDLHVPYRNSKLTRILKDFMNKNNVIKFLVCLKQEPQFVEESLITLNYAFKAQKIEKKKNMIKLQTNSNVYYLHKIEQLQQELKFYRMKSSSVEKKKKKKRVSQSYTLYLLLTIRLLQLINTILINKRQTISLTNEYIVQDLLE